MATGATAVQAQNVRRLLYMFGAVTQIELNGFLDTTSVDSDARKREIRNAWSRAADRFEGFRKTEAGAPDTISTKILGSEANPRIQELVADPYFVSTFSNYQISFEEVEIGKLIACQRTVHLEYVDQLKEKFEASRGDLFDFCLRPPADATKVNVGRTAPNAFTASSSNPGLRFLGGFEQPYRTGLLEAQVPGGQPVRAVTLVFGYGNSTMNAYRVGNRLILNNGFHRMYTLGRLGFTHVPIVVQQIRRPKLELPPQLIEFPREYLIEEGRPALMKDFFDDELTCELSQQGFMKSLQIAWATNESLVPR